MLSPPRTVRRTISFRVGAEWCAGQPRVGIGEATFCALHADDAGRHHLRTRDEVGGQFGLDLPGIAIRSGDCFAKNYVAAPQTA